MNVVMRNETVCWPATSCSDGVLPVLLLGELLGVMFDAFVSEELLEGHICGLGVRAEF